VQFGSTLQAGTEFIEVFGKTRTFKSQRCYFQGSKELKKREENLLLQKQNTTGVGRARQEQLG